MRATEIETGDQLWQADGEADVSAREDATLVYTVVRIVPSAHHTVTVLVRYEVDGGQDIRAWDADQDVPLTRPTEGVTDRPAYVDEAERRRQDRDMTEGD